MKLQRIETPDYVLWVSDKAGEPNVYRLEYMPHKPHCYTRMYCNKLKNSTISIWDRRVWKGEAGFTYEIIAYQPKHKDAPKLNLPLLPDFQQRLLYKDGSEIRKVDLSEKHADLLPEMVVEDDVESLTLTYSKNDMIDCFIEGYHCEPKDLLDIEAKKYIQSLKQPKTPKWFVAEVEKKLYCDTCKDILVYQNRNWTCIRCGEICIDNYKLKTTTIKGKTYLVGKFVNE